MSRTNQKTGTQVRPKPEHYFTKKPASKLIYTDIDAFLRGRKIKIKTASGIFSQHRADKGTELLIDSAVIAGRWDVLDLGCGYGIVGIALKKAFPELVLVMSDINERAVLLAKENADANKIEAEVVQSDIFENLRSRKFDAILLNPPQTAGKKICIAMIEQSRDHLKNDGLLQVVARHKKGGKSLSEVMEKTFGNLAVIAKRSGYRVYVSRKTAQEACKNEKTQ